MKGLLVGMVMVLLAGCGTGAAPVEPVSKEVYLATLGPAVCSAVADITAQNAWNDEKRIAALLEHDIEKYVVAQGIDTKSWLAAKGQYFTAEEHEKLMKFHVTSCLVPLGAE